ncbi:MAG: hypothetical protein M0027_10125 [Candidatus Dormibacteraeota bacterium]|nr:hypothetical protein [Candidatus Dormibacteraeota bacterium]
MTGLVAAVLTTVVGAALLLFTGIAVLLIVRSLLRWRSGGARLGCLLLIVLFILWLVTGLASGTGQPFGAVAPTPTPAQVAE